MSNIDEADVDDDVEMRDEDSFSNSADASSDEEDADEEKINEIQKRIEASPYTYDLHVQLISLCRKLGDLDKLRAAREKMSELFPLTPELWLDWLNDEKTLAVTSEQKEHLTQLFERAVKDYAAVSIWLEYVQFAIGKIGETWKSGGLETIRQTFEKAVTAVGIHVTQGYLIWEAYKEFESVYFLTLQSRNASEEEVKEQEKRIYSIYKRQLSIPLIGMDKTYEEFREKFDETSYPDIAEIDYAYKKALKKLNSIQQYEEALMTSEAPHYEEFKAYIQYEKGESEPIRVQNLYERALIENCLKDELWLEYTKFMDYNVKIRDMSLSVYERAVRNCPWCVQLWASYGRALERYEEPHEKIIGVFETALSMGFAKAEDFKELWLAYLDYLRRRISTENVENNENVTGLNEVCDVFDRAVTQMQHC
ncbi:Squamous cell carcinoma antigen recognized by T-cells 3, partial [Stegodyphus mimosarum]